jgi:hypothetical protein
MAAQILADRQIQMGDADLDQWSLPCFKYHAEVAQLGLTAQGASRLV